MPALTETERFARLPKWAQDEIDSLRNSVESYKHHIDELSKQHPDSNVGINTWHMDNDGFHGLPKNSTVQFRLSSEWHDRIECRVTDKGRLQIMGHYSICVYPGASNTMEIAVIRR